MKLLMIALYRARGEEKDPVKLCMVSDLSQFNFFTKGTVKEHLNFATRTVCKRTPPGVRQSIEMKDNPFICHTYVRRDGLCGTVVADTEYPARVAYTLLNKEMSDFEKASGGKWVAIEEDQELEPQFLKDDLAKYQDPQSADKLTKIQKDLDEIKEIMHKNIDEVLKRGHSCWCSC